jgi:membrane protein implicated in regulation of membrane protease activity
VQALNLCFSVGKGAQVATLAGSGVLTAATWVAVAMLSVPSVVALLLGMRLRDRIDAATYRSLLRKALGIMALLLVGRFFISS